MGKGNIQERRTFGVLSFEIDMNEAVLIFVSPYFQLIFVSPYLRAEALMAVHFSFIIEGIKETLEWFQ